jgi:hypothetical protein
MDSDNFFQCYKESLSCCRYNCGGLNKYNWNIIVISLLRSQVVQAEDFLPYVIAYDCIQKKLDITTTKKAMPLKSDAEKKYLLGLQV